MRTALAVSRISARRERSYAGPCPDGAASACSGASGSDSGVTLDGGPNHVRHDDPDANAVVGRPAVKWARKPRRRKGPTAAAATM
jgi:hypothetical protein